MLYQGTLITNLSGKLDGVIASHNRGGPYFRAAFTGVIPDPSTEQQQCQDAMAAIGADWTALSPEQRDAWNRYSKANPRPNRIGIPRVVGGKAEHTRANFLREQVNQRFAPTFDTLQNPPTHSTNPGGVPTYTAGQGDTDLSLGNFSDARTPWALDVDALLAVYISDPQPTTVNFFNRPYTLAGFIQANGSQPGTTTVPIPIPTTAPLPRLFLRFRIVGSDGAESAPFTDKIDTV